MSTPNAAVRAPTRPAPTTAHRRPPSGLAGPRPPPLQAPPAAGQRRRPAGRAGPRPAPLYSTFSPAQAAGDASTESAAEAAGQALYEHSCITCHGANLEGVPAPRPVADRRRRGVGLLPGAHRPHAAGPPGGRGPGEAVDLHRRADRPADGLRRRPTAAARRCPSGDLRDGDLAQGGELFRLNCASCHNFVGEGGALSSGKTAPSLQQRRRHDDLHGHAHRPGEHAGVRRQPADPGAEALDHQLHPDHQGAGRPGRCRHRPHRPGRARAWSSGSSASASLLFGIFWMGSKA